MRKNVMAISIVILMLIVPFTGCSVSGGDIVVNNDVSVGESASVVNEVEEAGDVRNEGMVDRSSMFYDDGNGMLWMFSPISENEATITGGHNYGYVLEMKVPSEVKDNVYLDASVSVILKKNEMAASSEYAVLVLNVKRYDAQEYSVKYLNIHFSMGDSRTISYDDLESEAGKNWIELTSGKKITISGIQTISVIDSYHCDSELNKKIVELEQGKGTTNYVVPSNYTINNATITRVPRDPLVHYSVVSIGEQAFSSSIDSKVITFIGVSGGAHQPFNSGLIMSVSIPNTVGIIGDYAFYGFSKLKKILFDPDSSLKTIGIKAFMNCGSSELFDESNYEELTNHIYNALENNNQYEATKENVNGIVSIACGRTLTITISTDQQITEKLINRNAFVYHGLSAWTPIKNKTFKAEYLAFSNVGGSKYSCEFDLGNEIFSGCTKTEHQFYIYIGTGIFRNETPIKIPINPGVPGPDYLSVKIPSSVESIGDSAFNNVQKLSFESNSNLKYLGSNVFQKLNFPVEFPDTITSFGDSPINYCPNISFANGMFSDGYVISNGELVSYLGNADTMTEGDLTSRGIKLVRNYAFKNNPNVKSVVIPEGVEWGLFPFYGCSSLETVDLSGISDVPNYLFGYSGLEDVTIPENIVSIGQKSFYNIDSLRTITVRDNNELTTIGQNAFSFNKNLKEVNLGSSKEGCLCTVDDYAFFNCNSLESVIISDRFCLQDIGKAAFAKFTPTNSDKGDYSIINFGEEDGFTIPSSVKIIGDYAFAYVSAQLSVGDEPGCNIVKTKFVLNEQDASKSSVDFSQASEIVSIGAGAFSRMDGLTNLDLSSCVNLESIGLSAFQSGTLKEVVFPNTGKLKQILGFNYDKNDKQPSGLIESLTLPKYVEEAGYLSIFKSVSFEQGSKLSSFTCDSGCYSEYGSTYTDLSNCSELQSVKHCGDITLPGGVYQIQRIGNGPIRNSSELATVDDSLVITKGTSIVNSDSLGKMKIIVDPGNPHFRMDNGCLVYINGSEEVIVGVSKGVKTIDISNESDITRIADGALKGDVDKLVIGKAGLEVGSRIFEGSTVDETVDKADVFILDDSVKLSWDSFKGSSKICLYADIHFNRDSISSLDDVYLGVSVDGRYVFFPETAINVENLQTVGFVINDIDQYRHVRIGMTDGYTLYDLVFHAGSDTAIPVIDCETLDLSNIDFGEVRYLIVEPAFKPRQTEDCVTVIFDGNGGSLSGESQRMKMVGKGLTLIDSDFPVFKRVNSNLVGWTTESGEDYDADSVLDGDLYLYAKWQSRNPVIIIGTDAGKIIYGGKATSSIELVAGSSVELSFSAFEGYDVRNWVVDGVDTGQSALDNLILNDVKEDCLISVTYRYYSPSSGLNPIINKGLPTAENIGQAVQAWEAGGTVDMSGAVWTGHSSVPLIVDDHVFIRVGNNIYKIESDTGYVVGSAPSKSAEAFYHQLGYGNGLIVDALTGYVYDTDLQLKFTVKGSFTGVEYYNGYFYTSGTMLYRFSADPSDASASGMMTMEHVGTFDKSVFSSYGFSSSVFENGYIYRVFAQGNVRGITAMDIDDTRDTYGRTSSVSLKAIESMYLDDGWISYYDGVLYLPGYTQGLFGAIATTGYSTLSYVKVNGLDFDDQQGSYEFEEDVTFVSEFVVSNGYGFVNSSGRMYVFKMNEDGTPGDAPVATCNSTGTHGSFTMDVSYATKENGFQTYFYLIPYNTADSEIVVLSGHEVDGGYEMTRTISRNFQYNYNSQAVRADNEGRMVWYNDSGQVYSYTIPEKNRFFFYIDDGISAQWYESYGATSAEALELLGGDVVTLSKSDSLLTVNGESADDWSIYYLKRTIRDMQRSENQGWLEIDNLYDRSLDLYHYYIITNDEIPDTGSRFTYINGDTTGTYSFTDNIGDRSIVGKKMVRGTDDIYTIRFFNGGSEIEGSALIGSKGSEVNGTFPSVVRTGYSGYWVLKGTDTEATLPSQFEGDVSYEIKWIELSYEIDAKTSVKGGQISFSVTVSRVSGDEDLRNAHLFLIAEYEDRKYLNATSNKLNFSGAGTAISWAVSTEDLVKVRIFVVNGMPSTGSFTNYGVFTYLHE